MLSLALRQQDIEQNQNLWSTGLGLPEPEAHCLVHAWWFMQQARRA